MIRAVLDTNILISATLSANGAPADLIRHWRAGAFDLVVSPMLLAETRRVFARSHILKQVSAADAAAYVTLLETRALLHEDPPVRRVASDPDDDYVVALAREHAEVLVTGDSALLKLKLVDLPIVSVRAFLDALGI